MEIEDTEEFIKKMAGIVKDLLLVRSTLENEIRNVDTTICEVMEMLPKETKWKSFAAEVGLTNAILSRYRSESSFRTYTRKPHHVNHKEANN